MVQAKVIEKQVLYTIKRLPQLKINKAFKKRPGQIVAPMQMGHEPLAESQMVKEASAWRAEWQTTVQRDGREKAEVQDYEMS